MTLLDLQRGVLTSLTGLCLTEPDGAFAPPSGDSLGSRWHIYASGYLARLVEALENDYPAVRRILGDGAFRSLTARYARRCPPRSFDIGRAGDRLARFLERDPLSAGLPFLPDLARFEWALAEAFVAADEDALAWADLAAMRPEAVADLELRLRAGSTIVRSRWPLFDLRDCRDTGDDELQLAVEGRPLDALVFRHGVDVLRRALDALDLRLLEPAVGGVSLAQLTTDPALQGRVPALAERFRSWVVAGAFRRPVSVRPSTPHHRQGG